MRPLRSHLHPVVQFFLSQGFAFRDPPYPSRYASGGRPATEEEVATLHRALVGPGAPLPPAGSSSSPAELHQEQHGRPPRAITFNAPLDPRTMPAGSVILGATVDCFAKEPENDGSRWVELAYAVSMAESDVTLSKEDFERAIANFARYRCCPVTIEHADTDWFPRNPAWAEPHGHVEELRLGERTVTEMDGSTRVAATLEGRVSFDEATAPTVGPTRKWRFGSITLIKGAVDEATGAGLGALLWSWSLTAHPRLMGLAPIAASLDPSTLPPADAARLRAALDTLARRGDPARPPTTETPMKTMLEIAAHFGLAATSEEDARAKVMAFLALGADAIKALGLAPSANAQELALKLSGLTTAAARTPVLEQELVTLRADKAARDKEGRDQYFGELFAVHPELKAAEVSLRMHAEQDWAGLLKAHPRPSAQELIQSAQHPQRTARVAPQGGPSNPTPFAAGVAQDGSGAAADVVTSVVRTHMAMARAQGRELTFSAALSELGG